MGLPAFRQWLESQDRVKLLLNDLQRAFATQVPECPSGEMRKRLWDALAQLSNEGVLTLPAESAKNWDAIGTPRLPRFISLVRAKVPRKDFSDISWVPALSFAPEVKRTKQLEDLARINEFVIANRNKLGLKVPFRERALQIFGDEKYLDNAVSDEFLYGKLHLSEIGALHPEPPLPREDFPVNGKPLLLLENYHTYWSLITWNKSALVYTSIAYGAGNTILKSAASLVDALQRSGASHVEYFGDLDPTGLAIPIVLNENLAKLNSSPVSPAVALFQLLLAQGIRRPMTTGKREHVPEAVWSWLPNSMHSQVRQLFEEGEWLPQEGVGLGVLTNSQV